MDLLSDDLLEKIFVFLPDSFVCNVIGLLQYKLHCLSFSSPNGWYGRALQLKLSSKVRRLVKNNSTPDRLLDEQPIEWEQDDDGYLVRVKKKVIEPDYRRFIRIQPGMGQEDIGRCWKKLWCEHTCWLNTSRMMKGTIPFTEEDENFEASIAKLETFADHQAAAAAAGGRAGVARARGHLGACCHALQLYPEALEHFQLLRDDLSAKGGAERSWRLELQAMRGLGDAHEAMGETRLAFQCYKECLLEAIERGDRAAEADLSAKLVPLYVGLAAGGGGGGGGPPPSAPATSRGSTPGNGPERSDAAAAAAQAKARAAAEAAWEAHQAQALEEAYRALEGRSEDEIAHLEAEDPAFLARCAPAQAAHYAGRCRRLAGQWGLPDPARGLGGGGGDNDESTLGTGMASSEYYGTGSFDSRTNSMDSDNKMDDENEDDDQKTEDSENQEFLDKEHQEQEDEDDDDSNNN